MELSVLAQHGLMVAIAALILPGMIVNWVSGLRIPWAAAAGIPTTMGIVGFTGWVLSCRDIPFNLANVTHAYWYFLTAAVIWRLPFLAGQFWRWRKTWQPNGGKPLDWVGSWWKNQRVHDPKPAPAPTAANPLVGWLRSRIPWWKSPQGKPSTSDKEHWYDLPVFSNGGIFDPRWILPLAGVIVGAGTYTSRLLEIYQGLKYDFSSIVQGWDVHWHASEVRFILERGIADSTRMGEAHNIDGHQELFYPSGWHAATALLARYEGFTPIQAINWMTIVLPSVTIPLSVGLIAWRLVGNRGLTAQIAAGFSAAIVIATPVLYWIPVYVGMWPYLGAISMTGIVAVLITSIPTVPVRMFAGVMGFMGVAIAHPAPITVVVFLVGFWWLFGQLWHPVCQWWTPADPIPAEDSTTLDTAAVEPDQDYESESAQPKPEEQEPPARKPRQAGARIWSGWRTNKWAAGTMARLRDFGLLAATGGIAVLLLWPQLKSGFGQSEDVQSVTAFEDLSRKETFIKTFLMRTRHVGEFGLTDWTYLLWFAVIGMVVALVWRRNVWGILFLIFSALITMNALTMFPEPWGGLLNIIGGLHYGTAHRLVIPVAMFLFAYCGVGVAVVIRFVFAGFVRNKIWRVASVCLSTIAAVWITSLIVPWASYSVREGSRWAIESMYESRMVTKDDRDAFNWLAKQPHAYDGIIFGNSADGYGWMYAYNKLPSLARHYDGVSAKPGAPSHVLRDSAYLIGAGNHGDPDQRNKADIAAENLGVNFIVLSPPNFWWFQQSNLEMSVKLDKAPGLTLVYQKNSIRIYAVNAKFKDTELTRMRESGPASNQLPVPQCPKDSADGKAAAAAGETTQVEYDPETGEQTTVTKPKPCYHRPSKPDVAPRANDAKGKSPVTPKSGGIDDNSNKYSEKSSLDLTEKEARRRRLDNGYAHNEKATLRF